MKQQLIFRNTAADGSKAKLQKATRIKASQDNLGYYFIAYSHNVDEAWQQVRIGRPGVLKPVQPQALHWGRREITLAKLKDLKALCAFIPVQFREFYTSLQAVTPSPRKLRTGPILKNTFTVSSEDEQDLSDEMFSSDSKFYGDKLVPVYSCPESATTKSQLTKRTQQALALREHLLYASAPISCATILLCSDVLQSTVSAIRRVTVHGPVVRRAIDLSCQTLVISTSPTAARRLVLCPLASFQVNN
ncbi:hypothetical protein PoB_006958300 [Plakobranchus ocellatus]|uniref:Uncharacterized protein n=1 Tax=Plakobranchus ocellatus TaxID=259542 RepID=A0AAV4DFT0_9GAST|nr:hypothetical protein PoB_006958300 [Plakobranchus ocellatus]